jgi:hypothetical protein
MKRYCCACGKQAIQGQVSAHDTHVTTLVGARAGFRSDEVFCGHCAKDLDENGLFPEERAQANLLHQHAND